MAQTLLKSLDVIYSSRNLKPQKLGKAFLLFFSLCLLAFSTNKGDKKELSYFLSQISGLENKIYKVSEAEFRANTTYISAEYFAFLTISDTLRIKSLTHKNESIQGTFDGQVIIEFEDVTVNNSSEYDFLYDYLIEGNRRVIEKVRGEAGRIVITNLQPGNYFNIQLRKRGENIISSAYSNEIRIEHGKKISLPISGRSSLICNNVSFTDCFGTFRSQSELENNKYYNVNNSYRPCGFFLNSSCQAVDFERWHCIEGDKSEPPAYLTYNNTNYLGVGLTALQAAKIGYILSKYSVTANGVANAIWAITNTGGSQNTIYSEAVNNASVDGSELGLLFLISTNSSYQNMVVWKPSIGCTLTVEAGENQPICEGSSTTLNASTTNGAAPFVYQWSDGTTNTYQAENGTVGGGAQKENIDTPFDGTGYIEYYAAIGEYFEIPIAVAETGIHNIELKYRFSDGSTIPMELKIDGTTVSTIQFIGTGGSWEYQLVEGINLTAGNHTLRLQSTINNGVDIDAVKISSKITTGQNYTVAPTNETTYTVTVTDVNGCSATDAATVSISGPCGTNTTFPPSYAYDCGDGKKVDIYGKGIACLSNSSITIPNPSNVFQVVVEVVYETYYPGSTFTVTADGNDFILNEVNLIGGNNDAYAYRGMMAGSYSTISINNIPENCEAESFHVYAFRNDPNAGASSGQYSEIEGYDDIQTLNIAINTDDTPRDLVVTLPISELKNGPRLDVIITAGSVSESVSIFGPDTQYGTCCLAIPEITLNNVEANATNVEVKIISDVSWSGGAQSYVVAGVVNVDVECVDCIKPTANNDNGNDFSGCPNEPLNGDVSSNDNNLSNPTYTIINNVSTGNLILNTNGTFIYTPIANFCGTVNFTYKVCNDGSTIAECCDEATVTLSLTDNELPNFENFPGDQTVSCDDIPDAPTNITAWDNCDENVVVTFLGDKINPIFNACDQNYTITRTWTATDDCGNVRTSNQIITVEDTTPPVITPPANDTLTVKCDGDGNQAELQAWLDNHGGATATDNCGEVTWTEDFDFDDFIFECGGEGWGFADFYADDECDNRATFRGIFRILDRTDPEITTPASNLIVECDGNGNLAELQAWLDNHGGAVGNDICSPFAWEYTLVNEVPGCGNTGSKTYNFKIIDECGNENNTNATFIIQDTQAPIVDCEPDNEVHECTGDADNQSVAAAWNQANIDKLIACSSDDCGDFTVTSDFNYTIPSNGPNADCGETGSFEVIYTIRDECGLPTFKTATFTLKDETPPTPVCQDITVQLEADGTVSIDPSQIDNGSNDVCGNITLVSVFPNSFDPSQCGTTVQVELTIRDECDNISTCLANVKVECFDLALRKVLAPGEDERVFPNDDVTFRIHVFNQGSLDASNIEVKDYIPTGLALNDADWANNATIVIPFLAAGDETFVDITLNATQQTAGQIVNRAEISAADAPTGFTPTDIDSDLDNIPDNDSGGQVNTPNDDKIDGNSRIGEDEDDADPEDITIGIFDLALKKEYLNTVPLKLGQTATFTITVFNQGTVGASEVTVVDYIPAGFQLVNNQTGAQVNGWSGAGTAGSQVTTQINGIIPAGESRQVTINLEVLEGVVANGDYINRSEISSGKDDLGTTTADMDSTPDDILGNDAGGQNDSAADNFVDGNGTGGLGDGVAATDEDDEDPEDAPIFDLALTKKTLVGTPVKLNQVVPFTIEITNQGNLTATSVEISDYIPAGFDLADNNSGPNGIGLERGRGRWNYRYNTNSRTNCTRHFYVSNY